MARHADMNVELAVALFEKGYPEARIEEALKTCATLDQAMKFLGGKPVKAAKSAAAVAAGPVDRQPVRRRAFKKGSQAMCAPTACAEEALAPSESTLLHHVLNGQRWNEDASQMPAAPTPSEAAESVSTAGELGPAAASTPLDPEPWPAAVAALAGASISMTAEALPEAAEEKAKHAASPVQQPLGERVIAIEPDNEEGKRWWKEAAARWPKIYQNLRLEASLSISRPECPLVAEYLNSVQLQRQLRAQNSNSEGGLADEVVKTPLRKRALDAEMEEALAADAAGAGNKRKRQDQMLLPTPSRASASDLVASPCGSQAGSPQAMVLNSASDMCKICCCDTSPWRSVRLSCGHGWYCAQCMLRHAEARLANGATSITCPECSKQLAERDLRKLLPTELIDRLLARSLEQAVSATSDIRACPTPNCPMRVALEEGDNPRFKCTVCKKDSCLKCGRQPFHRGLTCEEYAEKLKANTKAAKKEQKAEESFKQWMEETGTKQCPTCGMAVSKQNLERQKTQYMECHKMSCRNCATKFCFKCLSVLTDSYTCGCTIDAHGFIDPLTGKILKHLKKKGKK
eukprot:TRINITY_DN59035_c0_g1_i1.p1 TRINITY_DN59035_c0_g1~~TRINITY_DN59035_c0_g1_i1.p1  ORF type:complete len:573 (-),score=147.19 TRINITY_DN59035_c0_g1_i1:276-1994(-)